MNSEMMISGKWFNKTTGDVVNVVNNVIDGDDMIVITDKGPINMKDFGDFIQMSEEIYDEHGKVIGTESINYGNMMPPKRESVVKPVIEKESRKNNEPIIKKEQLKEVNIEDQKVQEIPQSENHKIISKFFDKIDNLDQLIQLNIDTNILPISDLKTIINYMDVPISEIANYIAIKLKDQIIENIIKSIDRNLKDIIKADN